MLKRVRLSRVWERPLGYWSLVLLLFLALSVVYTWPAALDFNRTIPGFFPSDQDQNIWSLWWLKRSLLDLHTNPFFTGYLFYPYGTSLYLHSLDPLNGLLALPWSILGGPIASFNSSVLLGLTLTGVAATALGNLVSGNRWAGLVAGYIITFGQVHFSFVNLGQVEFINLWPLLLYLICLLKLTPPMTDPPEIRLLPPPKRWWVAGTVAALLVATFTTLYYAAFAALLTALYVLFRGLQERKWAWWKNTLVPLALAWFVFAVLFAYQGWRIWQTLRGGSKIEVSQNIIVNESVTVHGYFSEFDGNVFLASLFGIGRSVSLNIVHYLGLGLLALAVLGFFFGKWGNRRGWRGNWVWLGLGLFFALASFGPTLRVDPQDNSTIGPTQFWLPWNWLQAIPLVNISHTPFRLALPWLVCLGVLAAQGTAWLLEVKPQKQPWLAKTALGVLIVILFLEGPALPVLNRVMDTPLQVSVIQQDCARTACGDGIVLDLPFNTDNHTRDHDLMLYSALRQQPVMGGYISRDIPVPYASVDSPFHLFLQLSSLDGDIFQPGYSRSVAHLLNQNNVRYVAANLTLFQNVYGLNPTQVDKYLGQVLGQESRIYNANGLEVFRVPDQPGENTPLLVPTGGWQRPEPDAPDLYKRWIIRNASVSIYTFEAGVKNITFEAVAFYQTRHLNVTLNGQPVTTLTVEPSGMVQFSLPNLNLKAGENLLQLDAVEEPQSPAKITPGSQDTRMLSIAIRQFKLQ